MNSHSGSPEAQGSLPAVYQAVDGTQTDAPGAPPPADGPARASRVAPGAAATLGSQVKKASNPSVDDPGEQARLLEEGVSRQPDDGVPRETAESGLGSPVRVSADDGTSHHYDGLPLVTLSFEDLTMDVVTPGDGFVRRTLKNLVNRPVAQPTRKRILSLEGVQASFSPGDCVALMGSSGAGKTTLLNVLSGRLAKNVGGRVQFNGMELPPEVSKAISCFVQQEVMFFGALTVQEHLEYQAALRLPPSISSHERAATVKTMIEKVGLSKVANSLIGNVSQHQLVGISGGEQRRLSVATELLTEPCVVFADEPTSGLDSYMAMQVVKLLKDLALGGRTVVCTIHQPSSSVFAEFNKVLLMSEGHILYCGPREASIAWFARLGQACEADMNPAEFLIKTTAVTDENREEALQRTFEWADRWRREGPAFLEQWEALGGRIAASSDQMRIQRLISSLDTPPSSTPPHGRDDLRVEKRDTGLRSRSMSHQSDDSALDQNLSARNSLGPAGPMDVPKRDSLHDDRTHVSRKLSSRAQYMLQGGAMSKAVLEEMKRDKISVFNESWLQIHRSALLRSRDSFSTYVKLITTLISALIPAFMYYRLTWQSSDAWNKVSSSFYIILSESMACLFGASMAFNKERPIIQREYESGATRMPLYFIGRITADSVLWLIFPFIYHVIVYWIAGLGGDSVSKYFASLAITLLTIQVMLSYTYVVVSLITNPVVSTVVLQIMQMVLTLFSGFMVKLDELGKFWIWIVYLSPFKYALPCFTVTIFTDAEITSPARPPLSGLEFLDNTFGFKRDTFWLYIGMMFVLGICTRLIGMVALTWRTRRIKENQ
ncbi:putative ABC transporter [Neospora caninum Liverpool]|uniref:ABC transporter, putative n=1 Tax=Neospora caninum (strain Liverpool) TaxID=572307 RepID=F0VC56_NEOCL|nr:putative ABC transporter [Neospora caninum Liverpool]CBZ51190.1 putative ABC transporter [Neospora caninum Liverpool]CEL68501.1 TPA: ABC transporter, putative [Neospora caninum Liverpool]|eukprot:XP_003881223.1 putative ABC transporter [Neospora caninum Liverpool]